MSSRILVKGALVAVILSLVAGSSLPPALAQGWEALGVIAKPVLEKGAREIASGFFRWFWEHGLCCPVNICGGRVWWVTYADGTQVANAFRLCRDHNDIIGHVVYGRGDCDWQNVYTGQQVCYENFSQAQGMLQAHGQIVDITHQ